MQPFGGNETPKKVLIFYLSIKADRFLRHMTCSLPVVRGANSLFLAKLNDL
jgi:hypothetical protein